MNKNNEFIFVFLFILTHIFFYFFIFIFFGLGPAQLSPAQPTRSGSLAQASDPDVKKKIDTCVKQFHACINSVKIIKFPSHCSNVIWTPKGKKIKMGAHVSGDCEEGCNADVATLVRLLSTFSPGRPVVFFSFFWDEQAKKIMGMLVFFEFFLFIYSGLLFFCRDEDNFKDKAPP